MFRIQRTANQLPPGEDLVGDLRGSHTTLRADGEMGPVCCSPMHSLAHTLLCVVHENAIRSRTSIHSY